MGSMVIRNIPDDVLERFKARAKAEGKSAEELGRDAIAEKAKPSREEILRRMEEIRGHARPVDAGTMLRIMRDSRDERDARPFSREDER